MSDADKRFQEELETAKALSLESQAMEQFRFEVKVVIKAELTGATWLYSVSRICHRLWKFSVRIPTRCMKAEPSFISATRKMELMRALSKIPSLDWPDIFLPRLSKVRPK